MTEAASSIEILRDGIVAPLTKLDLVKAGTAGTFDGAVFHSDLTVCSRSLTIKNSYKNVPGKIAGPSSKQFGKFIFGGMLQNTHFGHFAAESLGRIWAMRDLSAEFDAVVFFARIPGKPIPGYAMSLLKLIDPTRDFILVTEPTQFEVLAVPDQLVHERLGFVRGHPAVIEMCAPLTRIGEKGKRKLYVSRSKLKPYEGGFLLEDIIEKNLIREGYEIIHPQNMTIEEQLAAYNSAESLIFAEGSSLHLYTLVARSDQNAFVVWRRKMANTFQWQLSSFGGPRLVGTPAIRKMQIPDIDYGATVRAKAEIDFLLLKEQLIAGGFISGESWETPDDGDVLQDLSRFQAVVKAKYIEHPAP